MYMTKNNNNYKKNNQVSHQVEYFHNCIKYECYCYYSTNAVKTNNSAQKFTRRYGIYFCLQPTESRATGPALTLHPKLVQQRNNNTIADRYNLYNVTNDRRNCYFITRLIGKQKVHFRYG